MARYIEATETADEAARAAIMDEILAYNREDLEATWAVMGWYADAGLTDVREAGDDPLEDPCDPPVRPRCSASTVE